VTRRAYLYFALTFLLGIVVGSGGILFYAWHTGLLHPRFDPDRFVRHLKRELNLNPTQVDQIRGILEESGKKMRDLRDQQRPQFDTVHTETQERIRQVLNPQQAAKFDGMIRRFEERRRKMGSSPDRP
jgi:hypothetical protein